jgi:hypothetical protein
MAARAATGPAHVAVVSFLAARAAPTGGFWIALPGGLALAHVAERRGARLGFGASAAAMLETVAIIGPARFGVPLTQALSAPILGRLHARGVGFWPQLLACAAVRLLHNAATTAFFIWVIAGGLDAYAGTYDAIGRRVGIEIGSADALALTLAGLVLWAAFASTMQVLVYRRGLRAWAGLAPGEPAPAEPGPAEPAAAEPAPREPSEAPSRDSAPAGRFDPRAVAAAALVAFVLLLSSTTWTLLAAVLAWLALAWALSLPEREPVRAGLVFAAVLAGGAFAFALGGGLGLDTALRRACRAALLVLVATWLRGGSSDRAARGLPPRPGSPAARAVCAGGSRGARRNRLGGASGRGGPRARRAPLGDPEAAGGAARRRARLGDPGGGRPHPAAAGAAAGAARPRDRLGTDGIDRRAGPRTRAPLSRRPGGPVPHVVHHIREESAAPPRFAPSTVG